MPASVQAFLIQVICNGAISYKAKKDLQIHSSKGPRP